MPTKKENFAKNFSRRLGDVLDGRSHTAVGQRTGYSRAVISKYATGDTPESFYILARLAEEYDIDLHKLITGKNAPSTSEVVKRLKPYAMAHLVEAQRKDEQLKAELITLLRDESMGASQLDRKQEIQEQIEELELYCNTLVRSLNEVLAPFGEGINLPL